GRAIEAGLRVALAQHELRRVSQPLLGLEENRGTRVQALLRWEQGGGTIAPVEFIPVGEAAGLIRSIGQWVLRQACRAAATWPGHVRVAVNLSPVQFRQRDLVAQVRATLAEAKLDPSRLELEITESLLLNDSESTLRALHELRAMGVRISMDDFGTGYSSLSYLRSF